MNSTGAYLWLPVRSVTNPKVPFPTLSRAIPSTAKPALLYFGFAMSLAGNSTATTFPVGIMRQPRDKTFSVIPRRVAAV